LSQDLYMLITGCVWVDQRLSAGDKSFVYTQREDLLWLGKALLQSISDCIEVPTYHNGSS